MHVQCCSVFVQCMSVRYRAFLGMSVVFKTSSVKNVYNRITYIRDMKRTKDRVLNNNIWQLARERYFGLLLHGIVNEFRTPNLRKLIKP